MFIWLGLVYFLPEKEGLYVVLCFIFQTVEDRGLESGLSLLFCAVSSGAVWFVSAMAGELI